jgi:hypothetical protein
VRSNTLPVFEHTSYLWSNAGHTFDHISLAFERKKLLGPAKCCVRPWVRSNAPSAVERTFGRVFTLSSLSYPLLAMFVAMTCTTQNTKNTKNS